MAARDVKIFLFPRLVVVRQFADRFQMQVDFVISQNFSQAHQMYVLNNIKWAHCLVKCEGFFPLVFYCLKLTQHRKNINFRHKKLFFIFRNFSKTSGGYIFCLNSQLTTIFKMWPNVFFAQVYSDSLRKSHNSPPVVRNK